VNLDIPGNLYVEGGNITLVSHEAGGPASAEADDEPGRGWSPAMHIHGEVKPFVTHLCNELLEARLVSSAVEARGARVSEDAVHVWQVWG
jgi:hypothetical protein